MAWIDTIPEDRWEGPLGDLFDAVVDRAAGPRRQHHAGSIR